MGGSQQLQGIVSLIVGAIGLITLATLVAWLLRLLYLFAIRVLELAHARRIAALEAGLPPPDPEVARLSAAGLIGAVVPTAMCAAAVAATVLLLRQERHRYGVLLMVAIWAMCGVISLVAVWATAGVLARRSEPSATPEPRSTDALIAVSQYPDSLL